VEGCAISHHIFFSVPNGSLTPIPELRVPYPLTFELYGANEEGRRPATWRLAPTPQEEFDTPPARRLASAHARHAARALHSDCLAMFNPDTVEKYRSVVAGWVQNFLLLSQHVADHSSQPASALPPPLLPPLEALPPEKGLRSLPRKAALHSRAASRGVSWKRGAALRWAQAALFAFVVVALLVLARPSLLRQKGGGKRTAGLPRWRDRGAARATSGV